MDKQVSCDGGNTWLDVPAPGGFNTSNDDGTNPPCAGWNAFDNGIGLQPAEDILVRYQVHNAGTQDLFRCNVDDSNPLIAATFVGQVPPGGTSPFFQTPYACSDDLAAGEPDTGTVTCDCTVEPNPEFTATAFDVAAFTCQTPGLTIEKTCLEPDTLGANEIEIQITNTGDADLENCVVVDELFLDDDTCPAFVVIVLPDAYA